MKRARGRLLDLIRDDAKPEAVVKAANALLSRLNSATQNVTPGDASTNRSIQDHFDPALTASPGGKNTIMTPNSKRIYEAFDEYDRAPDVVHSPGVGTVSSHHHSNRSSVSGILKF